MYFCRKSKVDMLHKTRGIVLHSMPYSDKYTIIYIYTEQFGRVSYMISRSRGKRSRVSSSLFMPLSVIEMEVEHKNNRDIHRIREARACFPIMELSCNPVKNVIALFLAEVLFRVLKETQADEALFAFLDESVFLLESTDKSVANFHLVFLLHLLHYLGIFPNLDSYRFASYFDMLNAVFVDAVPMHKYFLTAEESQVFANLLRISFDNMHAYAFSRADRVGIVNRIIEYYRLHLPEFPEIKSIAVMQSLFD